MGLDENVTVLHVIGLPCSVSDAEAALHRAAHEGHWHHAVLRVSNGELQIVHPNEET